MPDIGVWTWVLVFVIAVFLNVVPAFMPPTWSLLAFVRLDTGLPIVGLAIAGGLGAVTGRFLLAMASRTIGVRFVPKRNLENIDHLASTLKARRRLSLSMLALFAIGPIPSNHLFIAAGIARIALLIPLLVFGAVRTISYVVWVTAADTAASSLSDVLSPTLGGWFGLMLQIVGFALLVTVFRTDWAKRLAKWLPESLDRSHDSPH